jgi:HAMP domain-containing protein
MYIGYQTGDFFLLRPWRADAKLQALFDAPAGTAWMVQSIQMQDGKRVGEHLFFSPDMALIERRRKPDYQYDPRNRDWYQQTLLSDGLLVQPAYIFFSTDEVGSIFAHQTDNGLAVAGVDITLRSVTTILHNNKITPGTHIALINARGEVLSSNMHDSSLIERAGGQSRLPQMNDLNLHVLNMLISATPAGKSGVQRFQDDQGATWEGGSFRLSKADGDLTLWIASPHSELLDSAISSLQQSLYIILLLLILGILAALALSRRASKPLAALTREAEKIVHFDFQERIDIESKITEVIDLADAMGDMKSTIKRFLALSSALASETNFNSMLARLLSEIQEVTHADASLIYLADADASQLDLARVRQGNNLLDGHGTQRLNIREDRGHPLVQALDEQVPPRELSAVELQTCFPALSELAHSLTFWALPLRNRDGELLGVLAMLVDQSRHPLTAELMAFVKAFYTTAAIALNTQRLIDEKKICWSLLSS